MEFNENILEFSQKLTKLADYEDSIEELRNKYCEAMISEQELRRHIRTRTAFAIESVTAAKIEEQHGNSSKIKILGEGDSLALRIEMDEEVAYGEINDWQNLNHPNIQPLLYYEHFNTFQSHIFVTPSHPHSLDSTLKSGKFYKEKTGLDQTQTWLRNMLEGLQYLHDVHHLCHLELNPHNVHISKASTALISGFSHLDSTVCPTSRYPISSFYCPPEVNVGDSSNRKTPIRGDKYDIWCLGVIALNIFTKGYLTKKLPSHISHWNEQVYPVLFKALQEKKFNKLTKQAFPNCSISKEYLRTMRNFILSCLRVDPDDRPAASQLLQHSYISSPGNMTDVADLWQKKVVVSAEENPPRQSRWYSIAGWFRKKCNRIICCHNK